MPVAIVGVGGRFPGACSLSDFWDHIVRRVDTSREAPTSRWAIAPSEAFDPKVGALDKVYSLRGYFLDDPLVPAGMDAAGGDLAGLDPLFHLVLAAGGEAHRDAGLRGVDPRRYGIILGNIALPTEAASAACLDLFGDKIAERLPAGCRPRRSGALAKNFRIPALPAAILAKHLGLLGPAYTLDAACASSLYALKLAADELAAGRLDAVLAGGVSRPDPLYTQMGFSQLRALSGGGVCRPFDDRADGLVVGEGAGIFVLRRLEDAQRQGETIYAVLTGFGLSNDTDGRLLAPSTEGQYRALLAAYEQANWRPEDIDLIECHATGTPVGDAVELESLARLWATSPAKARCIVGGVKANVGHMLTAAGAAGLMKLLFAFRHRVLPPTANWEVPTRRFDWKKSPFEVLSAPRDWDRPAVRGPRRAALNAFGFGGINAHVLLEEPPTGRFLPSPETLASAPGAIATRPVPVSAEFAVVGLAVRLAGAEDLNAFADAVLGAAPPSPRLPNHWWGIESLPGRNEEVGAPRRLNEAEEGQSSRPLGWYFDEVLVDAATIKIPPRELLEMLPQQVLMLDVARAALRDAGWSADERMRTGVFLGVSLDPATTHFHVRWSVADWAADWARRARPDLTDETIAAWIAQLRDALGPALTPNRVMGALAGILASRVAREFGIGGPCIPISHEERSGCTALEVAMGFLERGELDCALVGAVDFAGDPRRVWARQPSLVGEGGVALVVRRLDDVVGRCHARVSVLTFDDERPGAAAIADGFGYVETMASAEAVGPAMSAPRSFVEDAVGDVGAASGLLRVAKGCVSLARRVLPVRRQGETVLPPRYWAKNAGDEPRQIAVHFSQRGFLLREAKVDLVPGVRMESTWPLALSEAVFAVRADSMNGILTGLGDLADFANRRLSEPVGRIARDWPGNDSGKEAGPLAIGLVASSPQDLAERASLAQSELASGSAARFRDPRIAWAPESAPKRGEIAFVYPASGNHYPGMGRGLAAAFPDIWAQEEAMSNRFRDQFLPEHFWESESLGIVRDDARRLLIAQVALGAAVTRLLRHSGLRPGAAIGYSLGESAALVALGAWPNRDELFSRMMASDLFARDLVGECRAARRYWDLAPDQPVDWSAGVVSAPAEAVRAAIGDRKDVFLLLINTPMECVIGGRSAAVREVLQRMAARAPAASAAALFLPLDGVSTVHCALIGPVADAYRALHCLPVDAPAGIDFYSAAWGRPYALDADTAADAILAQATRTVNFPAVVEAAYQAGIRIFIEVGPGSSASRMISATLGDRPHLARSACAAGGEVDDLMTLLAHLVAWGVPVDLAALFGKEKGAEGDPEVRPIRVRVRAAAFSQPPALPELRKAPPIFEGITREEPFLAAEDSDRVTSSSADRASVHRTGAKMAASPDRPIHEPVLAALVAGSRARAQAQEVYLRMSRDTTARVAAIIEHQLSAGNGNRMLQEFISPPTEPAADSLRDQDQLAAREGAQPDPVERGPSRGALDVDESPWLDGAQCRTFAVGKIGDVLGPEFAAIDAHPSRVRLPDEPLLFVDRILSVEGVPRSLGPGRVVTEHDVLPGAWYLDGDCMPAALSVEAGQADLFLSAYLGIDFETRGEAMYRLLDAAVTFHRGLPRPGETIRYDIRIERFFRQGQTHLFRFRFDGTIAGAPFITMRDGCAGFFTAEELAAGRGLVRGSLEREIQRPPKEVDWMDPAPQARRQLGPAELERFRAGDLVAAFGSEFAAWKDRRPFTIPTGRLALLDRLTLVPGGGAHGLGFARGEADIRPEAWFLACHFSDDPVMPGTLMYESCLQVLRVFLARMGWIGEAGSVSAEPVVGVTSRLRCRGQVIPGTRMVTYEVTVKRIGFVPDAFAIADAVLLADGRPIVEISDMSVSLRGLTQAEVQAQWLPARRAAPSPASDLPVYDKQAILEFAIGRPSAAFGPRFRPFDSNRFLARLPGPPYDFLDRVEMTHGKPLELQAPVRAVGTFAVRPDAWYLAANRQADLPYAVLAEAALQVCGFISAYAGSALSSDRDLHYRNLGGTGTQRRKIRAPATLRTEAEMTRLAKSGDMLIQHFDFRVSDDVGVVYEGNTYFGFFTREALAEQAGIKDERGLESWSLEKPTGDVPYPREAPFPDERWRMIDVVESLETDGGIEGLGYARGSRPIAPSDWYFPAHFRDDPVQPGSLGLEAIVQLLKVLAAARFGVERLKWHRAVALDTKHEWIYRGQVLPSHRRVRAEALVRSANADRLVAGGRLSVDGRVIYLAHGFSLELLSE